jgi:two-component system, chemotaxis family, sensor kinase CheA
MSFDQEMQAALQTFIVESLELLQTMEDDLLNLEQQEDPTETIAAIFRAAHTIKGSSGLFGLDHIVAFTHVVESVLDIVREGHLSVSNDLVATLLNCRDHMTLLIQSLVEGKATEDPIQTHQGELLLEQLRPYLVPEQTGIAPVANHQSNMGIEKEPSATGAAQIGNWHLSLRFGKDSLRNGMDPLAFIRYLSTLGSIVTITTLTDGLPDAEDMDPETCYLGFEIDLKSDASKEAIEAVFEFVREDSIIHILPPNSCLNNYIELIRSLPEDERRLGELLIDSGVLTRQELDASLQRQQQSPAESPVQPIGTILVESQAVPQPLVDAALEKQKQVKDAKARENQSIRVDADKLDKLIDLVGELVISCAAANLRAEQIKDSILLEANAQIIGLVEEVRDSALKLRMVPIGLTFNRFQRVVRDVSAELGKDITLIISGGDTEVDKSVIEQIGDPLMHLVRNSMDHGIENAQVRAARGKSAKGKLTLNAFHESGSIVIEVSDDGGGLNRDKILAKALEKGLIQSGTNLSDKDVFALIFEPGFSTADQVSNLSGRGVGMDVVKQNITALRGTIEVNSVAGEGTTIRIHLPLTLAIIDGFLVAVGNSYFVIPQDRIVECVELPTASIYSDYMDLRGEVLPFIRLGKFFNINREPSRRQNVVVVNSGGSKTGLIVDHLLGEFQTVIKPLGKLFNHVQGIGGSTILGSGEVALIIDVQVLTQYYTQREHAIQKAIPQLGKELQFSKQLH